jgi:predicted dehydrogenase
MPSAVRVLVLGAGSIGSRHARELLSSGAAVDVADPDPARARAVSGARAVPFNLDRLTGYDGIVVASPTTYHQAQLDAALATDARILVEKPVAVRADGLAHLVERARGRAMVGYNLRFHVPVRTLVDLVHDGTAGTVRSIRLWFGSWLPDWRPGVDYRTTYSARSELGGGVLLDAIHELDLLIWLAGDDAFTVVGAVVDRLGPLAIDVEDSVKALLRHETDVLAEVSLDYLSRRYRRGIEVVGDAATVRLDWARRVIEVEDAEGVRTTPADTPVDQSYRQQAQCFLDFVRGNGEARVDLEVGAASVRLADRIRDASA